ncbi:MAG: glycosyltransferase family 4 protein [Gemmatimonadetes bacterium]|nr:glycosyltransferase family 4 protein [Gemmatimonadota bacterium]MYD24233.1 glycosyltransferase family 4 protein [Gemmatimonadota bacterium]
MTPTPRGRVCFFGTYERDYPRNRTLAEGLKRAGWQVLECHVPLWEKERDKTGRYLGPISLVLRAVELKLACLRLLFKFVFTVGRYDVMLVGYIGHFDMPLAWLLTRFPRRPLVFSPLISLYDTLVDDRRSIAEGTLMSRFLRWLDRQACAKADLVLLDTEAHIDYFVQAFNLPPKRFARVFVGAVELDARVEDRAAIDPPAIDPPAEGPPSEDTNSRDAPFRVMFIGKFIPLHGLPFMLEAANRLKDVPDIEFHFVGSGQLTDEIHETARRLNLANVRFTDWIPYEQLHRFLQGWGACLGIFGTSDKAVRVIPGKVFVALSAGKAVITADSPAIRELLADGESAILCRRGDPEALAGAVRRLHGDRELLRRIAEGGSRVFRDHASTEQIGRSASAVLEKLVTGGVDAFR